MEFEKYQRGGLMDLESQIETTHAINQENIFDFKVKGTLVYNPERKKLKKTRSHDEFFLVLNIPNDIGVYYRHLVYEKYRIVLSPPAYGCHITVLDARKPVKQEYLCYWKKYINQEFTIDYSHMIYKNWNFWCLPVRCIELVAIRHELGFFDDKPLHLTVGRVI